MSVILLALLLTVVMVAVVGAWYLIARRVALRPHTDPCPRCGTEVREGIRECPECGFDFFKGR